MLNAQRIRGVSLVGEEKVYGKKDLPKSQVSTRSEWKTKVQCRVHYIEKVQYTEKSA